MITHTPRTMTREEFRAAYRDTRKVMTLQRCLDLFRSAQSDQFMGSQLLELVYGFAEPAWLSHCAKRYGDKLTLRPWRYRRDDGTRGYRSRVTGAWVRP